MDFRRRFPAPGHMVNVGGHRLHYQVRGDGPGPTVVVETGRMNPSSFWLNVQEELARVSRVVTYDRAGYGWSDPAPSDRSGQHVVNDLHTLLHKAEVPGPYLLVGHSLGGMYARLFAERFPNEVAGLVLIDPYTEGEVRGQSPEMKRSQARFVRVAEVLARMGVVRLLIALVPGITRPVTSALPLAAGRVIKAQLGSAWLWQAVAREWAGLNEMVAQLEKQQGFGGLPLTVVSAGRQEVPDALWALQKESQAALTRLSTRSRLVTVPDCGHGFPLEESGVRAIVDAVGALQSLQIGNATI